MSAAFPVPFPDGDDDDDDNGAVNEEAAAERMVGATSTRLAMER
jgi:hypothetical protein